MRFKGDIIITDPYYVCKPNDWEYSDFGEDLSLLGFTTWISRDTIYGDWLCTVFKEGTEEELGEFCADTGKVAVMLLDEVLKYNPDFDYHINKAWTAALIKDFDGEIDFEVVHEEGVYEEDTEWGAKKGDKWENDSVRVIGKGNINFFTLQTGL